MRHEGNNDGATTTQDTPEASLADKRTRRPTKRALAMEDVTYGLWALNREVNHKVDTLAGGCLAVERDEGGGRVERGSTGGT